MSYTYDDALKILANTGPQHGDGAFNQGAMVAGALISLERSATVIPWVRGYRHHLVERPPAQKTIIRHSWQTALGDPGRFNDWLDFFKRELSQTTWPQVLSDWLPRLIPGLAGGAGYGFLRAAYVLPHLARRETYFIQMELAEALSAWAAFYLKLPGILATSSSGTLTPAEALSRIKWQYKGQHHPFDHIRQGLEGLADYSPFTGVINLVALPDKPAALISQTTETFARVLLAHGPDPRRFRPYVKALLIPSALRLLLPHLPPDQSSILLRYAWQFAGAMYAIYGQINPADQVDPPRQDLNQLVDQALAAGDGDTILFTDACLREYVQNPKPAYLAAAWHAVKYLAPSPEGESDRGQSSP